MGSVISQNYAEALFMLANDESAIELFKKDLMMVDHLFKNDELRTIFNHPNVLKEDKKKLLGQLVSTHRYLLNFLMVLIDKSRIALLSDIAKDYEQLANKSLGIITVILTSACELSKLEKEAMIETLSEKLKQTIELECRVDESMLAGIKVEVDGHVLDNTAASKLARIREKVNNITLKIEV